MPEGPAQKLLWHAGTGSVSPPLISLGWGSGIGRQPERCGHLQGDSHLNPTSKEAFLCSPLCPQRRTKAALFSRRSDCEPFWVRTAGGLCAAPRLCVPL